MVKGGLLLLSPLPAGIKTPVLGNSFAIAMGQSCGTVGPPTQWAVMWWLALPWIWVSSLVETTWECVALKQQRTHPWLFLLWLLCPNQRFALPCRVWSCNGQKVWAGPRDPLLGAKKGRRGDSLFCGNNCASLPFVHPSFWFSFRSL